MINDFAYVWTAEPWKYKEIMLKTSSVAIPTDVPVGSVAYTADLSYIALFDGENWVQIGGSSSSELPDIPGGGNVST